MKKYVNYITILISIFLLTGCSSNKFDFDDKCFFIEEEMAVNDGICFDSDTKKVYSVIEIDNKIRGTYSVEDTYDWEQLTETTGKLYKSITATDLLNNKNTTINLDKEYSLSTENNDLTITHPSTGEQFNYNLFSIKLDDIIFDTDIDTPVTFMGESSTFELSNMFLSGTSAFSLPIHNIKLNEDYTFLGYGTERFYVPKEDKNKFAKYEYMYRNLLSKYRLCYETDNGKDYYNYGKVLMDDKITYYNIDYCKKFNIEDDFNAKKVYEELADKCYRSIDNSNNYLITDIRFSTDLKTVLVTTHNLGANIRQKNYNLTIKDGIYTFDNKEIIITDYKAYNIYHTKLLIDSVEYTQFSGC